MGFRKDMGATFECGIQDGLIIIPEFGVEFKTTVKENIELQKNMFIGEHVMFFLVSGNHGLVGIDDGGILQVNLEDGLLEAVHTWDIPVELPMIPVGYYCVHGGVYVTCIDPWCNRILHVEGTRVSYVLNEGVAVSIPDEEDLGTLVYKILKDGPGFKVLVNGGEVLDEQKHGHYTDEENIHTVSAVQFN